MGAEKLELGGRGGSQGIPSSLIMIPDKFVKAENHVTATVIRFQSDI